VAADLTLPSLTTEYVQVAVQAQMNGEPYDPTGDTVQFAFVPGSGYPVMWYAGSWTTNVQGNFLAQCLVGPTGTVQLVPSTYTVWCEITDNPEVPVRPVGSLQIT
jgi:hypothetical protein